MQKVFRRTDVTNISYDGEKTLECYDKIYGQKWSVRGKFSNYFVTDPYGAVKDACFIGSIDMDGISIPVEVTFSGDEGVILEKATHMCGEYTLIEANPVYAVFWNNGKEEHMVREPNAQWEPYAGILYGRIDGSLLFFSL